MTAQITVPRISLVSGMGPGAAMVAGSKAAGILQKIMA